MIFILCYAYLVIILNIAMFVGFKSGIIEETNWQERLFHGTNDRDPSS